MPAPGKVYIYNTTNQTIRVEVNDTEVTRGIPPNKSREGEYLPVSSPDAVVDRSDASYTPDAVFATSNTLEVKFPGSSNTYPIEIDPGSFPTEIDLVLYIFYRHIVLVSTRDNAIIYNG